MNGLDWTGYVRLGGRGGMVVSCLDLFGTFFSWVLDLVICFDLSLSLTVVIICFWSFSSFFCFLCFSIKGFTVDGFEIKSNDGQEGKEKKNPSLDAGHSYLPFVYRFVIETTFNNKHCHHPSNAPWLLLVDTEPPRPLLSPLLILLLVRVDMSVHVLAIEEFLHLGNLPLRVEAHQVHKIVVQVFA